MIKNNINPQLLGDLDATPPRRRPAVFVPNFLLFLLIVVLMAPLGIIYYGADKFGEIPSMGALALLTTLTFLDRRTSALTRWIFVIIPCAVIFLALIYGLVFSYHAHVNQTLQSALAVRWQFYWLIFPITRALAERGIPPRKILLTYLLAFAIIISIYLYCQETWDLKMMADKSFSGGNQRIVIRAPDEWRGYRLPDPQYAITMTMIFIFSTLFFSNRRSLAFLFLAIMAPILSISFQRLSILFMIASYFLTIAIVSRKFAQVRGLIVAAILVLFFAASVYLSYNFTSIVQGDRSGQIRMVTMNICIDQFLMHPWLGYGVDSAQAISYQSLFGIQFFPSDVGFFGIAFTYGIVGILIFLSIHISIIAASVRNLNRNYENGPRHFLFATVWAAIYFAIGAISLQPALSPDGIISLALLAAFPSLKWNNNV